MSNSALVVHTNISPNKNSPRNKTISKITIHHMAGNLTIESCGNVFAPSSRQASSNYGVGTDGRVGLYVDEADRSWASSSPANDNMAVTIEVANSSTGGNWPVSAAAYNATIDLCVDICRRNGISSLNFTGNETGTLTLHKFFAATACPGPYLEGKMSDIAAEINTRLTECANIQTSVQTAANTLKNQGIINTPAYWYNCFGAIRYLGSLIIAMANAPKKSSNTPNITTAASAITVLQQKGVINTPQHWLDNYQRIQYLDELLINVARRLA